MQLNITGHHVEITPPLRLYVENKLQKLQQHFSNITTAHVVLTIDKKFQQKAEARLHLAKAEVFAESESEDMYAAIDLLMQKLKRQVIKHKEKLNGHGNGEDAI